MDPALLFRMMLPPAPPSMPTAVASAELSAWATPPPTPLTSTLTAVMVDVAVAEMRPSFAMPSAPLPPAIPVAEALATVSAWVVVPPATVML